MIRVVVLLLLGLAAIVAAEGQGGRQHMRGMRHGEHGAGDGAAGAGLDPPPANVAFAARRPMAGDGYLFWTIAEGGVPVDSTMPPFRDVLEDDEAWQIIAHLRSL